VIGQAEEQVRPDLATITFHIVADRTTANDAAAENARVAAAVVDGLKGSGVDAKDIATVGLSLTLVMSEQRDPKTNQYIKSIVTGYHAANVIRVVARDIDRAGALITAGVQNGALYDGVDFDVTDRDAREDALRVKAAANAMHRAGLYAEGGGMKLATLRSLSAEAAPRVFHREMMKAAAAPGAATAAPVPVEPGLITLSETVNATFDLANP
jgi:uncharacterized protein YggE